MKKQEKDQLSHEATNSFVIIKSLAKSASSFVERMVDVNRPLTAKQIQLFKDSMQSIQQEISKIETVFQSVINKQ